jgi:hypothetical protein
LADPKEFKHIIGRSVHVIEFLLSILSNQKLDSRTFKLRAREEVIPYVPLLPNKIDQDHFEAIIAEALQTTKEAVHFEVERAAELMQQETVSATNRERNLPEQKIEAGVIDVPKRRESVLAFLLGAVSFFPVAVADKIKQAISQIINQPVASFDELVSVSKRAEVIFKAEAFVTEQPRRVFDAEVIHALNQLRELTTRQELQDTKELLKTSEAAGDQAGFANYLNKVSLLQRQLQTKPYTVEDLLSSDEKP